jgi:hypothetical protein
MLAIHRQGLADAFARPALPLMCHAAPPSRPQRKPQASAILSMKALSANLSAAVRAVNQG